MSAFQNKHTNKNTSMLNDQAGLVSIMVTVIIMLVISLIVIGFARLVRREQRQALDRQLSTQAFYAAESGINDAIDIFRAQQNIGRPAAELAKDDCGPNATYTANPVLNSAEEVEYTCLLVDPAPYSLDYSTISTNESTAFPLQSEDGRPVEHVNISWQDNSTDPANYNTCPNKGIFPPANQWPSPCNAGVLRLELVPIVTPLKREDMMRDTLVAFIQPDDGSITPRSISLSAAKGDIIVQGNCHASAIPKNCNVQITGLATYPNYYVRLRSIYSDSAVNVTGYIQNVRVRLTGAQSLIDSTGKAADVLRRVVVRIPTSEVGYGVGAPDFAIFSASPICKRYDIAPNFFNGVECGDGSRDDTSPNP